jgi:hypothetical protein
LATTEFRPSAPTTTRARSTTGEPPASRPLISAGSPSATRTSSTVNPSRTSAPAAAAASSRILSSTVRRGAYATGECSVPGAPASVTGPKSNVYREIGGQPVAVTCSSSPHRRSASTPGGWMKWVDTVSLGNVARSTTSTR